MAEEKQETHFHIIGNIAFSVTEGTAEEQAEMGNKMLAKIREVFESEAGVTIQPETQVQVRKLVKSKSGLIIPNSGILTPDKKRTIN